MFWHFAARVAAAALSLPALLFALRFFQQTGYNVARGYIRIASVSYTHLTLPTIA